MDEKPNIPFFARVGLAFKVLGDGNLAARVAALLLPAVEKPPAARPAPIAALPPEKQHASALAFLGLLQREGRFVDFLQQDVAAFSDEEIGAAARVVHTGCRKVIQNALAPRPIRTETEGAQISIPAGFDAQQIRLTGTVSGPGPFRGSLRHHGWLAGKVELPEISPQLDARVLAPAEIEIGA